MNRTQLKYTIAFLSLALILSGIYYWAVRYIADLNIGSLTRTGIVTSPTAIHLLTLSQQYLTHNLEQTFIIMILAATAVSLLAAKRLSQPIFALQERIRDLQQGRWEQPPLRLGHNGEFQAVADDFNQLIDTLRQQREKERQILTDAYHQLRQSAEILRNLGRKEVYQIDQVIAQIEAEIEELRKPAVKLKAA
ncbi:MAG: hypothetical protein HY391_06585 [Deltaproteobacteria bacterium]|nr:hypothetical protein [Deltaproteobacteria bacterium]